jgi:cholesterol oxidase
MSEQRPGIKFSETMAGGLMLGEGDCRDGEKRGRMAGDVFAMHAVINIDDMQRFITDPSHPGALSGNIDYSPLGNAIPCSHGKFNLFSPTDDPQMKYMIYELGFEHDGKDYYVAGHKEVKDDPGFDLWSDTTTLYTKLHQGKDDNGPVIGAGVLTLGITELMKLVASMEVTHADSLADKAHTLTRFGRFFMGELWDIYFSKIV